MLKRLVSMTFEVGLCIAIVFGWPILHAQSSPADSGTTASPYIPHMTFDVASIRESHEGHWSSVDNLPNNSFYHAERTTAWGLILRAYDIKIGGLIQNLPDWGITTKYNIEAKSDSATDEALAKLTESDSYIEKRHMMRALLADRFKLQIHPETRVSTTYELTATAQNARLMIPVHGDVGKTISTCDIHYSKKGQEIESKGCPLHILLSYLVGDVGTEVADHTGLSGMYAYHLMWSWPSETEGDDRYPTLVDALHEQLGLDMKKRKGPVTFWVVDHIERPTPN